MPRSSFYSNCYALFCFAIGMSFTSEKVNAQQDTLYFSTHWKPTVKDSASFYRPPIKKEGDLFRIKDYYLDGTLQMKGLSKSADKEIWEGKVTWYKKDGSIFQQGTYTNGRLEGEFITVLGNEKLIALFKNNRYVTGQQNISCGGGMYLYTRKQGDTIVETMYGNDINGLRYETYKDDKNREVLTRYYDSDGSLIGKRTVTEDGYVEGLEVSYYRDPMRIREIRYYRAGKYLASTNYYSNGQVRTEFIEKPEFSKTFYAPDGTVLGKMTYILHRDFLKPISGKEYYFDYRLYDDADIKIKSVIAYDEGEKLYEEQWYNEQALRTKTIFENGQKKRQVSYDDKGMEIAKITYDNYLPVDGTEITKDRIATYKDGNLVEEINYYPDSKTVFNKKTNENETFFDKTGEVLGVLTVNMENGYAKPVEGKRFTISYDGDISLIEEYEKTNLIKSTSFRKRKVGEDGYKTFKNVEIYEAGTYNRNKEITFYSNGSKQSEIEYEGYNKTFGTFYDPKEIKLGDHDYTAKDGILYEFFGDSDEIRLIEEWKSGTLVRQKRYNYGRDRSYGKINPVLELEMDINCCAKFYDREGLLLAEVSYKNGIPWTGAVYDHSQRTKYEIKEGKRNGSYTKLDHNGSLLEEGQYAEDEKTGLFKYYDYLGNLKQTEQFDNGELNGKAVYYDADGNIVAAMTYKNGLPVDGVRIIDAGYGKTGIREVYKEGMLNERVSFDDNGKRITKYEAGKERETVAYYGTTDKKRLQYQVQDEYLDGEVVRYTKDGKEEYKATFAKGVLEEGTVMVTPQHVKGGMEYMILTREPDRLKVTFVGQNDKILFKGEEDLAFGAFSVFLKQLNIYTDYLTPDRLY